MITGITNADTLNAESNRLHEWLTKGYHGELNFLARSPERRCNPKQIMPECKTVIVAAMRYEEMPTWLSLRAKQSNPEHAIEFSGSPRPSGARDNMPLYLQHEDYHKVMMKKLEAIVAEIKHEYPDAKCKCYVDTGPVLEKAWGVKAGLGFIGKNTLLISPLFGSQMALGVVLTSIDCHSCESRNPELDCGSCTACIDACPTKALVAPYILDARRCISYKFFIGKEKGGCDICQDVCPYNR